MADDGVRAVHRDTAGALRGVKGAPGEHDQRESAYDEHVARDVQRAGVGGSLRAEDRQPQMARVVREQVDLRILRLQPARKHVERKRHAVHFREQRHDERREAAERAPFRRGARPAEAERENHEHERVHDGHPP